MRESSFLRMKKWSNGAVLMLIAATLFSCSVSLDQSEKAQINTASNGRVVSTAVPTFTNPIDQPESADPWVFQKDGYYYYCVTTGFGVTIHKSNKLENVASAPGVTVWSMPGGTPFNADIWAPELHYMDGKWYIYTCGSVYGGIFNGPQQMFVLEGNSQDPLGTYTYKGILSPGTFAIDETVLVKDSDGSKYLVWSQFDSEGQCIYIAPMSNPWTVGQPHVKLSSPDYSWERGGNGNVNEGPQILKKNGKVFIIYSASGCWSQFYCLGQLKNTDGNYLNPGSWLKSGNPVFQKSDANGTYGVGHCSFTKSPNGNEDWLVYHGMSDPNGGQPNRSTRIQMFTWNSDDTPNFGVPVRAGTAIICPDYSTATSGPEGYTYCADENQNYTFSQTVDVAYGANGQYAYKTGLTGTVSFNNANFGDPIPGFVKKGYYKKSFAAYTIPGKVEAENYSAMYGIQTENCTEGTLNVGWIETGDFCDYYVNVTEAGTYTAEFHVAGINANGSFDLKSAGTTLVSVRVPSTGGWQNWTTIKKTVYLAAGIQTLRVAFTGGGLNIDWIKLTAGASSSSKSSSASSSGSVVFYAEVTAPFAFDGTGTHHWKIAHIPSYVNSWSGVTVKINGMDVSGLYMTPGHLPSKQNGYYYIDFTGTVSWSHIEVK